MKDLFNKVLDIFGDAMIVSFGIVLIYVFMNIEVNGSFGQEPNKWLRWFELIMGGPIALLGITRLIKTMRK